jgi:mycothiol synthase
LTVEVDRHDGPLAAGEVADVRALADAAGAADRVYPLAEHVLLHLRHEGAVHLLTRDDAGQLVGYAYLDTAGGTTTAELVVHPGRRRRGLGRALVTAAMQEAGRVQVWAHGDHPAATALAGSLGFTRSRVLYQLRRSLVTPIPDPALPEGVTLRTFRPGADDAAWLAVNARAFADHPEQGRWTEADLRMRMAEPWFDPAGFLLAVRERDGQLVGFHWTKIHRDPDLGEVYVLGVDPSAHGLGLGTALTLAGLRHLRERELDRAMLYVDESNRAAVALYTKLGFERHSVDVMFARRP